MRLFIKKIQLLLLFQAFVKALLAGLSVYFIAKYFLGDKSIFLALVLAILAFLKLSIFNKNTLFAHIHQHYPETEFSLALLEKPTLTIAETLQLERLEKQFPKQLKLNVDKSIVFYLAILFGSLIFNWAIPFLKQKNNQIAIENNSKSVVEKSTISTELSDVQVIISPPAYSNLPINNSDNFNISCLIGSQIEWKLKFSNAPQLKVSLVNNRNESLSFEKRNDFFVLKDQVVGSGFYAIKAYWKDSLVYESEFYRLEAIRDEAPIIEPLSKELYQIHYLKDAKTLTISAKISDDFMVKEAYIVATLARGSGENVKFREMKIPIDERNFRSKSVSQQIHLNKLNFTPGDELYYHWEALDNKNPEANLSLSDTYFVVYKDTAQIEEAELATMAMNIMPEYFRSQRQIIIDTEKLIAKRNKISSSSFNSISNEIGFDQKALRLRYGQYLGEENEGAIGATNALPDNVDNNVDMLKSFRHDHDEGEHEHEEKHEHHASDKTDNAKDGGVAELLADYVHSHDDGELNTYYEKSTKSLLKMALEQMWQSELHLRLYEPEKALPFEKKALEYLKNAQQKARTFVKKTSFSPPPIKEKEKRFSGELTKFNSNFKYEKKLSIEQLENLIAEVLSFVQFSPLNQWQKQKVLLLGNQLSERAVRSQLSHWKSLTYLQKVVNNQNLSASEKAQLSTLLYEIIEPEISKYPKSKTQSTLNNKKLENAFWKNINH